MSDSDDPRPKIIELTEDDSERLEKDETRIEKIDSSKIDVDKMTDEEFQKSMEALALGDSELKYEIPDIPDLEKFATESLDFGDGSAMKDTYVEIEAMVKRTNEMNAISSEKTREIEQQFKDIQKRLDKNVEILNTIKEEMRSFSFEDEKARLRELHDFDPGDCLEGSVTQAELEAEMEEVKSKLASLSEGTQKLSTISRETLDFSKKVESAIAQFDEIPEHE